MEGLEAGHISRNRSWWRACVLGSEAGGGGARGRGGGGGGSCQQVSGLRTERLRSRRARGAAALLREGAPR